MIVDMIVDMICVNAIKCLAVFVFGKPRKIGKFWRENTKGVPRLFEVERTRNGD